MKKSQIFLCKTALPALTVLGLMSLVGWSQPLGEETASGAVAATAPISYATSTQQSTNAGVGAGAAPPRPPERRAR